MDNKKNRLSYIGIVLALGIAFIFSGIGLYNDQIYAVIASIFFTVAFVLFGVLFKHANEDFLLEVEDISSKVKRAGRDVFSTLPIGVVIYDANHKVLWANKYADKIFKLHLKGHYFKEVNNELEGKIKKSNNFRIMMDVRTYQAIVNPDDQIVYFFDETEFANLQVKYDDEATVLGIISLDNYEESLENIDEHSKSEVNLKISQIISNWAIANHIFVRKYSNSSYLIVLNEKRLSALKESQFKVLDEVRDLSQEFNLSLTLSMGISTGDASVVNLGHLAKSALDLALIRGGDQVAIKSKDGKTIFYGGKTDAMEKRNRVRARVIAQSVENLIKEASNVLIMGHRYPDYDSVGSAIGMYKICKHHDKTANIVFEDEISEMSVKKLMTELSHHNIIDAFVEEDEALELIDDKTLLILVDNHKPSLVTSKAVLDRIENKVVIDHHRRGDEFIKSPLLTYLEPYASSTCELVTELMEYQHSRVNLSVLEATSILGGIVVDTKHFTFRTGTRTFDAAAYLKTFGADSLLISELLKEDIESYFDKIGIIRNTEVYHNMAIAVAENGNNDNVTIAKVANTLLEFDHIQASFVISKLNDEQVGISARSLGDINVQIIMEALGGGGHLTGAATQITGIDLERAQVLLKEKLDELILIGDEEDESNLS